MSMTAETLKQLKEARDHLYSDGWGHDGPDPIQLRDVLEKVIAALLLEKVAKELPPRTPTARGEY